MYKSEIVTDDGKGTFKILIIGDVSVGKSSLLLRFADNKFDHDYKSTIGVDYRIRRCSSPLGDGVLRMYDTAGQERFRSITTSYYRGVHGFMVVYDVTEANSFYNVKQWLREIQRHSEYENVSVLLVGNKCDLGFGKVIKTEQAEEYANSHGILFIETSAKNGMNIEKSFRVLTEDLIGKKMRCEKGAELEGKTFSSLRFIIPTHCTPGEEDTTANFNTHESSTKVESIDRRRKRCSSCTKA